MNFILRCRLWILQRRRRARNGLDGGDEASIRQYRADFMTRYKEIYTACVDMEPVSSIRADLLAREYMTRILELEREENWWRENSAYVTKPWFIWEYGCMRGLITPPEQKKEGSACPLYVIRPQAHTHEGCVQISEERALTSSEQGVLYITYTSIDEAFAMLMRAQGFHLKEGRYVRKIGERAATLSDRVVENAVLLLDQGYAVCVDESALKERIYAQQYTPEHRYWVLAPAKEDKLRLSYPRDQRLHQYVCKAGAKWNGQYMEISISNADKIEELMRLYGFRASKEAQRRLEAWHVAFEQATVYRARRRKSRVADTPEDMFMLLLNQRAKVIEDLRETDE